MRMPISSGQPATEPVSLADAKLHLGVTISEHDSMITAFIKAARRQAEQRCQRSFADQEWTLTLDEFPDAIRLPMPRATSVTSLKYLDPDNALQTAHPSGYLLDNASEYANWLVPALGYAWPATLAQPNSVIVVYRAGSEAPEDVKLWIKMLVAQWYECREAGADRAITVQPSPFWDALLDPYRVPVV